MDARTERCKAEYEGKHYFTKNGKREFVIINYDAASSVDIEFIESGFRKHTNMGNINIGLPDPFEKSPIAFEDNVKAYIGCCYKTNQGCIIRIIGGTVLKNMTYQFQDEFGYIGSTTIQNIKKGEVRNPYFRNEFGGYLGVGNYNGKEYEHIYSIWHSLIVRATGGRAKYSYYENAQLYQNCKICEEWLCYNTFADWYIKALSKLNPSYYYEINKDLLYPLYKNQTGGYKLYSPTTVSLLPKDLNLALFNITRANDQYEQVKATIIELAKKYYDQNAITLKTFNAIMGLYGDGNKVYIDFRGKDYVSAAYRQ